MTPQEQVKMLRAHLSMFSERLGCATHAQMDDIRMQIAQVLAATAPPKPYFASVTGDICTSDSAGQMIVFRATVIAAPAQIAAVLDALNALAEQEADRG